MLKIFPVIAFVSLIVVQPVMSQSSAEGRYKDFFNEAYNLYPEIPKGILEAIALSNTGMQHIKPYPGSYNCLDRPAIYGVMGLVLDGKGYFKDNLKLISNLSGYDIDEIIKKPEINILAFAAAYSRIQNNLSISQSIQQHVPVLNMLTELPNSTPLQNFAMNSHLYNVLQVLINEDHQQRYGFPKYKLDLRSIFGEKNLRILSSRKIIIANAGISNDNGEYFDPGTNVIRTGPDYKPALWSPIPSCNYSSRNGASISAVVVHTTQGSYAGSISWAQNCSSNISFHYIIRSSDGQVTQLLMEADKGWHAKTANSYTIGIEHEGFVDQQGWYTDAMYTSSALLVKDIINSGYGINGLRTYRKEATKTLNTLGECTRIKGHQHFPDQTHTDPGQYWDWDHYFKLINDDTIKTTNTTCSGSISKTKYQNDERNLTLIQVADSNVVVLKFDTFDLEKDWDYLYIYDGPTVNSPRLVRLTGNSLPGDITSTGNSMLIEFHSDCATVTRGWSANWSCKQPTVSVNDQPFSNNLEIDIFPNPSSGYFTVKGRSGDDEIKQVSVYNMPGNKVYNSYHPGSPTLNIDLSGMKNGIYIIRISTTNTVVTRRITITK